MKKTLIMVLAALAALTLCLGVAVAEEETPLMTYEEFLAADVDSPVHVEAYVQDNQSWWDNKITVYLAGPDHAAYFVYEMPCSQEDAAKLVPGQKVDLKGYKAEWAGEVEIIDAVCQLLEGDPYIAEAEDVTALLGTDDLIKHMNEKVVMKGMTVEPYDDTGAAFAYKNPEEKTDDLYFKVSRDGQTCEFCVEFYLRGSDSDVYKAVENMKVGDVVDVEGFLYWYNGPNLQATALTAAK